MILRGLYFAEDDPIVSLPLFPSTIKLLTYLQLFIHKSLRVDLYIFKNILIKKQINQYIFI